jgi:hypothetical protein
LSPECQNAEIAGVICSKPESFASATTISGKATTAATIAAPSESKINFEYHITSQI